MGKSVDVTIISKPVEVRFSCPYCGAEHVIDYDNWVIEQLYDYWGDWHETECTNCEKRILINSVEYD